MAEVQLGGSKNTNPTPGIRVIDDSADLQKPPMGKRLFNAFFMADSPKQIAENLLFKVFIPELKGLFEGMLNKGIHMMFFGDTTDAVSTSSSNGFVSYGSFWNSNSPTANSVLNPKQAMDFDMPVTTNEAKAMEIITQMKELISLRSPNGYATVAELYQSVGRTGEWTDEYYGWKDLSGAMPVRLNDGRYLVKMPKAVLIR